MAIIKVKRGAKMVWPDCCVTLCDRGSRSGTERKRDMMVRQREKRERERERELLKGGGVVS